MLLSSGQARDSGRGPSPADLQLCRGSEHLEASCVKCVALANENDMLVEDQPCVLAIH